jgi:hypothetical protein
MSCSIYYQEKSKGKMPFGRPKPRWRDGIELDITEIAWKVVDWIDCTIVRNTGQTFVNTVMNVQIA